MREKRIYLVGFMGAGKTTVGESLARHLEMPFVDVDTEVERRGGASVREIFERHGEPEFRRLEHEVLVSTAQHPRVVVATGGGSVVLEANLDFIRRHGVSVWLNPSFATLSARIGVEGKSDRPLFRTEAQAFELFRQRLPAYARADLRIDVSAGETPEEVAARIALLLQ